MEFDATTLLRPEPLFAGRKQVELGFDDRRVRLTNLQKPFWPELGITKGGLIEYYLRVSHALLPHVRDRAMVMKRYPNGWQGDHFFMKRAPAHRPDWIETCRIGHRSGNVIDFPMVQDVAALAWVINLGCIDLNQWYARCDDVNTPDYVHFDMDPVPGADWHRVLDAALLIRDGLTELDMPSYPKTTGSRGFHIYVPIVRGTTQKRAWTFAKAFARLQAERHPDVLTAEYRVKRRPEGRVLVDYNQNAWGSTLASVYSVRPRPDATVSMPVTWAEVEQGASIQDFTFFNAPDRIRALGDLFAPLLAPDGRVDLEPHITAAPGNGFQPMNLPISSPYPPMEARNHREIPTGPEWVYEPKWDGFRCLIFRDGDDIVLQSKSLKPLGRYFPEVVAAVREVHADRFVIDGEIVVPVAGELSFDHSPLRVHPAESRVRRLAAAYPALVIAFDMLVTEDGELLVGEPFAVRRRTLLEFAAGRIDEASPIHVSPQTTDSETAHQWLKGIRGGVDGVMAKQLGLAYASGQRAMRKIKRMRTADCVVGGFRYGSKDRLVGSLLLGLFDENGTLHHVGFTSGLKARDKPALTARLEEFAGGTGFTGRAPGGQSRWSTERSGDWVPLRPELVVEVEFDYYSEGRFRHGTRILRWRPDKAPEQCTMDQVARTGHGSMDLL